MKTAVETIFVGKNRQDLAAAQHAPIGIDGDDLHPARLGLGSPDSVTADQGCPDRDLLKTNIYNIL